MTNKQRCQKAAKAPACLETVVELKNDAGSMQSAADIMNQLHALFVAIRKLGGQETQQLARVGEGLAADWSDLLSDSAESAFTLFAEHDATSPATEPANHLPPCPAAPAEPRAVLPMDAYDAATLHLEKAETLAEMMCVLGPDGFYQLTPSSIAGAFLTLQGELIEIRAALNQRVPRGDK